jgi:hypothetical protein
VHHDALIGLRCLRVVESEMASQSNGALASWLQKWHLMPINLLGPGRADLHLGRGASPRPDTLMQTGEIIVWKPLANGARHTF